MKKLSLILAGALLLGGISFASPVVKAKQEPAKTTAVKEKKVAKKEKKVAVKEKKVAKKEKKAAR
jgi:hypothetical protein